MTFVQRMVGAARLDARVYEEVEADRGATGQALGVVVLSAVAAGLGAGAGVGGLIGFSLASLVSWVVWAWLIWLIGARLMPEADTRADVGELLRTLGFAAAPGIVRVLGVLPFFGRLAFVVAALWMLVTMVVAVRQALDYRSTGRAIVVCLLGWLVHIAVFGLLIRAARVAAF